MTSNDIAIRVEGLGKRYQLGQSVDLTRNFREALMGLPRTLRKMIAHRTQATPVNGKPHGTPSAIPADPPDPETPSGTFWALRDVNFEIKRGEVVGIIGRNGAGKSTLLKLLSRITWPTAGRAELRGRLASLLEVGTGFHPELTGRENIYLNGAILGMRKHEIAFKFDEIVDFAEIERFLDTPVKRYSSGMYVRLAFAVAAHLEPEILIVDEVLAVGDAAFQKKCLGRMNDVAKGGRTVLFVSHNMAAVQALCTRAILLVNGRQIADGAPGPIISQYQAAVQQHAAGDLAQRTDRKGDGRIRFTAVRLLNAEGNTIDSLICGDTGTIVLEYSAQNEPSHVVVSLGFYGELHQFQLYCQNEMAGQPFASLPRQGRLHCRLDKVPLAAGIYTINIYCEVNGVLADWIQEAYQITVQEGDFFGTGKGMPRNFHGCVAHHSWCAESRMIGS